MSRNLSEAGVRGTMDGATTHRDESPLARLLRTNAQLIALRDTGIKTNLLLGTLKEGASETASSIETKPR